MPIDLYRNPLSDTIFVFGSNLAGRHGAGAAKFAAQFYGAEYGIGEGITGKAYALPTKDANIKTLAFEDVQWHCQQFLDYARRTRDSLFQLTRVGCGLAGLRDEDMAPLFKTAPENVLLPGHWVLLNKQLGHARLVVAGGDDVDSAVLLQRLEHNTAHWRGCLEVITLEKGEVAQIAKEWAVKKGYPWTPFPADASFGENAGLIHNEQIGWYATHALLVNPGPSTQGLESVVRREGLKVKVENLPLARQISPEFTP